MGKRKNRTFCSRALAYILCFLIVLQASPIAYAAELGSPSPQDAAGPVAAIGGNTYEDLASAFAAAEDGQKIELKRDADVSSTIQVAKSVTFDLGGHTVNANVGYPGVFQFATAGVEATFTNGNIMNTGSGAGIAGKAEFSLVLDGVDFTMGSGNAVSLTGRPCANATAEIKSGTFTSRHQYPLSGYDNETFTLAEGVKIVSSIDGMSPVSYCGNDKTAILPDGCYANVEVSDSGVTCTITKGIAPMVKGSKGYYHTVGEAAAAGETSISLIGTVGSPDSFVADSVIPAGTSVSLLIPAQDGEQVYYGNIEVQGSLTVNTYTSAT